MTTNAFTVYPQTFRQGRAYLLILLFTAANLLLAAGCHIWPFHDQELARMFLPTFFFTLIAAYKYGIFVGVTTAVLTVIGNYFCFDYLQGEKQLMVAIAVKTVLMSFAAGFAGEHFRRVNIFLLAAIVIAYQVVGTMVVCVLGNDNAAMIAAFTRSWPGMLVQIFGGWLVLRYLMNK